MFAIAPRRVERLFVIGLLLLALAIMLTCLPRALLYPAPQASVPEPPPPWREVAVPLRGGTHVHAWWRASEDGPVVLYFHGNGENLGTLAQGSLLTHLAAIGSATLVVDYPGYGRSPGRPSEDALSAAADATLAWAEGHGGGRPVVACGWSLGAAIAVALTARAGERVDAVILASPWTRLEDVAAEHFPRFLLRLLLAERYDSLAAAAAVRVPALVLHGARDGIIPARHGRCLARALAGPTRLVEVPDAGHNDLFSHPQVWREIAAFVSAPAPPS